MTTPEELKMYSDYKSPYAWLGFDPAFALEEQFAVKVKWKPFQLRIKGSGQRSVYSEYKVKYSYMDARRTANERSDKKIIRGPLKIYDTTPALIGGLFAEKHGKIVDYSRKVFELFFKRELAIDEVEAMTKFMDEFDLSGKDYRAYFDGDGQRDYESAQQEATADQVFGVPCAFSGANSSGATTVFRCWQGGSSRPGFRWPRSSSPPDCCIGQERIMIELYFAPTPNGWKISVMLEECGLPYTVFPVNITRGEQLKPAFLQFSPNGRLPAIVDRNPADGGEAISMFESGAILRYLAEKTGRFYPADLRARCNVEQWPMWQMGGLGPMLGQNGHFLLYAPEKILYAVDRYGREARRLYGVLDAQLEKTGAFIAGEYSIADIACFPWIMTHKAQGLSLDDTPHLKRWFAEVRVRPQVQRGVAVGKRPKSSQLDSKARESLFGISASTRHQDNGQTLSAIGKST